MLTPEQPRTVPNRRTCPIGPEKAPFPIFQVVVHPNVVVSSEASMLVPTPAVMLAAGDDLLHSRVTANPAISATGKGEAPCLLSHLVAR
jgi:hypothetical protein